MWENNSIQLANIVNAGVQPSYCSVTSQNSKYFAYSAFLAVYIIDQETLQIVNMIVPNTTAVSTLALCNRNPDLIAISYQDSTLHIINVVKNNLISHYQTPQYLVSLCWGAHNNILVGFTKTFDYLFTINLDEGGTLNKITGRFPNIRTIATTNRSTPYFVGGNDLGDISLFDYVKGKVFQFNEKTISKTKVCAVDADPQSGAVVIIWREGIWALFDIDGQLILMNSNSRAVSQFGACCWITDPPGHFITGDFQTGIIRIWNSSATQAIDSFTIHPLGFIAMQRLNGNRVLCAFTDGMISVVDLNTRKFVWKTNAAHRNTIFKLEFHPNEPNYVISCGAEGAVCTWDARNMNLIDRILPQKDFGHIFSMTITPGGGYIICGYEGAIAVFSNKSMQALWHETVGSGKIVHLSISQVDPNLLLIGSIESGVTLYNLKDRTILKQISENQTRYAGCAFNPHVTDKATFAVCNDRGFVYIYDDFRSTPKQYYIGNFSLYSVDWSPHNKSILGLSADSGEAIILDTSKSSDYLTFVTHKHESIARAFVFHPTMPDIVASTGYDGRVAICDIKTRKELVVFYAHVAYIYGLAFSPVNPYLLMTSGSDTVIKQWNIDRVFVDRIIEEILNGNKYFLRPYIGYNDLEKLARRVSRTAEGQLTFSPSDIIHINDVVRINTRLVKKLTSTAPNEGNRIKQAIKQRERLVQAAQISLHEGDVKKYCELMFEAGERNKALMAAASVSVEFWQDLMKKSSEVEENPNTKLAFLLASGNTNEAIQMLADQGNLQDAMLVACAAEQKCFNQTIKQNEVKNSKESEKMPFEFTFDDDERLFERQIGMKRSQDDLKKGNVFLAAANLLSVGDVESAILLLFNCGELFASEYLNRMFDSPVDKVSEEFGLLCINHGFFEKTAEFVGKKVFTKIFPNFTFSNDDDRNTLISLTDIEIPSGTDILSTVHALLINGNVVDACKAANDYLMNELQKEEFDFVVCRELVDLLEIAKLSKLDDDDLKNDILLDCYIIAAYKAIWYGFPNQLNGIIRCVSGLAAKRNWALKISENIRKFTEFMPKTPNVTINTPSSDVLNVLLVGNPYVPEIKYGPLMKLDDMDTYVSLNSFIKWRMLTRLSPLGNDTKYLLF